MPAAALSYIDDNGRHTVVLRGDSTSLGRLTGQDLVLNDPLVSRRHAAIMRENGAWIVVDQKSTHGTFLNGIRVERAQLHPGDDLRLGSLKGISLLFHELGEDQTATSPFRSSFGELLASFHKLQEKQGEKPAPGASDMERLKFLLDAARKLNQGSAVSEILAALLELTLQLTGVERGFVFLKEGDHMRLAQGLGADGAVIAEDATISRRAIQRAIESKQKFSISDTLEDERASEWSSIMSNRIRSIYCIPLRKRVSASGPDQIFGLLYLDSQVRPGSLSELDHQLLDTIATEAAALIENVLLAQAEFKARQAREELAIAARIHSGLMSGPLPSVPFARLAARSVPCLEIGGDFYDVVVLDDSVCVAVVDVSGKGITAAIVAATMQGIIHAQLMARHELAKIAALVNEFLCARNVGKYATMVIARLFADGRIEYLNCGHVHPLVIQGSEVFVLKEGGLIVGLIPGAAYTSAHHVLHPGERLLLVSDGITETENANGDLFGMVELSRTVLDRDIDGILNAVAQFRFPAEAFDDCTLLEVRYTGNP
ncbi:MAG TPA: SpoIIE family protein phosphatase [Terracidiphilus sp.]|nr:SpoIIE family protein phosphatase [Terracidiphilus sp.]